MKQDFTSAQVGSMLMSAEVRHAARVELKKYELKQLELAVDRRERAVSDKARRRRRWSSGRPSFGGRRD